MSVQRLPAQIAPFKLARQGQSLSGTIGLKGMARLTQMLSDNAGDVAVELHFGVDEQGAYFARGHLSATVQMACQRCMKPMTVPLETDVALGFVSSDERAAQLSSAYEPCLVTEEPVALVDIVEDELILALPIVALHAGQACHPLAKADAAEAGAIAQAEQKPNPFAVLSELKRQK